MPKIPTPFLRCTFYLYATVDDAKAGTKFGGTGFFVAVPSVARPGAFYPFAISNWHVTCRRGFSVIRVNKLDGGIDIFDLQPDQWEFVPGSYDVAAAPVSLDLAVHDFKMIPTTMFLGKTEITNLEVGPGENVFMSGRFIDHGGVATNQPALRFGHISMMPEEMIQFNGVKKESYCIDMHSRTGFSGSPVFAWRTSGEDLSSPGSINNQSSFLGLLGIHWGQFPEYWSVEKGKLSPDEQVESALITDGQSIKGLSGMTCVAPTWSILETLDLPKIQAVIQMGEFATQQMLRAGDTPSTPAPG